PASGTCPTRTSCAATWAAAAPSRCPREAPSAAGRGRCGRTPSAAAGASSRRVRLVGSSGRCAGRVEVYSGGSWSSVCQEGWDLQDAAVVCRELGCGRALEAPSSARFGGGTGPLWPYMAECSGSEESLWECGRSEERECGRGVGAGAVCSGQWRAAPEQGPAEAAGGWWPCRDPAAPLAEQISVRLAGGRGRCRGSLEVSYNGTWGRVCSNGTSTGTAGTVCRQLGCGEPGRLSADTAQQPSRAWLAWVGCEDGAHSLWDTGSSARACIPHMGLAGIPLPSLPACVPKVFPGEALEYRLRAAGSGELRLVGGGGRCAGRVEVKHDGEWGSVCVFDFDWKALWASVVCRQLGCGQKAWASPHAPFGQGTGRIWLQPFCNGTENGLEECRHFGWGRHFCNPGWHAGVTCTDAVELRLAGGGSPCAGRVEVKLQGRWGSVADPAWNMKDAEVVCQQLGCGSAATDYSALEHFGEGDGPVSLSLVNCKGSEANLWDCDIRGWEPNGSIHDWDTAVVCQASSAPVSAGNTGGSWAPCSIPALTALPAAAYTGFRLGNGSSGCSGRVEVAVRGTWGSVCASEWDLPDAHVLCRHLGCGRALSVPPGGSFGSGEGPLRPDTFGCSGSERHPGQCPVTVLGKAPCAPGNAAAVNCSGVCGTCGRSLSGFWDSPRIWIRKCTGIL
uniref:SRCR domain-containing protein n=1 Tax=Catharus ustulatus TaxID=91951 RepID=A0A8C3VAB4_CATUS